MGREEGGSAQREAGAGVGVGNRVRVEEDGGKSKGGGVDRSRGYI